MNELIYEDCAMMHISRELWVILTWEDSRGRVEFKQITECKYWDISV